MCCLSWPGSSCKRDFFLISKFFVQVKKKVQHKCLRNVLKTKKKDILDFEVFFIIFHVLYTQLNMWTFISLSK